MMMKEEHIVRRMLDLWSYQGKQKRVERCVRERERDVTEVGLKKDNATNRAAWRNMIISYTGDPR